MSSYGYVDHVLANYFSAGVGLSEEEGIASLRKHLSTSRELSDGFRADLHAALEDSTYSWSEALAENDVIAIENEVEAKAYARKLLWPSLTDV
jgi:hypothetical protein